jgi:hypothetical protein
MQLVPPCSVVALAAAVVVVRRVMVMGGSGPQGWVASSK